MNRSIFFGWILAGALSGLVFASENRVPNGRFEITGSLGSLVTNTPSTPTGFAAAAAWSQSLLAGTYLITRLEPSTDALSGGCGHQLSMRAKSPPTATGFSVITANLSSALPVGSRGQLNIKVLNGSARVGFLPNAANVTGFDAGSVTVTDPPNVWRVVTFTNLSQAASAVAIQLSAPAGQEAALQVEHASATPAATVQASRYDFPGYLGPSLTWGTNLVLTNYFPAVGDFNGDGLDDVAAFVRSSNPALAGNVFVGINTGSRLLNAGLWQGYFGVDTEIPAAGDFDGDGLDDIVVFVPGTGKVWVALSTGTSFCTSREWWNTTANGPFFFPGELPMAGDVNGDGRVDILSFARAQRQVYVALSSGTNFINAGLWQSDFCPGTGEPRVGDVNGDGRADIVCFVRNSRTAPENGRVEVALSSGTNFSYGPLRFWHQNFAPNTDYDPLLADLSGDGSADILAVHRDGRVFAAIKTALNAFASGDGTQTGDPFWQWHPSVRRANELVLAGRFNGDRNHDLATFSRGMRSGPDAGSVFVALAGGHAQPEPDVRLADFGFGTLGTTLGLWSPQKPLASRPAVEVRPLLVLLAECRGSPLTRSTNEYQAAFFGPAHPNIAAWFSEMSDGKFTFSNAATVRVVFDCPIPGNAEKAQLEAAADADGPGGFEFKNFDGNGDGIVDSTELSLCAISTFEFGDRAWGQSRLVDVTVFPATSREVRLMLHWAGAGDRSSLDNLAHELGHGALDMQHFYGFNCRGLGLTVASCTAGSNAPSTLVHLDPWNKMRLGWTRPWIYDLKNDFPAGVAIPPAQATGERPVLLFDSSRGTNQFFLLEHRNGLRSNGIQSFTNSGGSWRAKSLPSYPAAGYDQGLTDSANARSGFLTWAIQTDANHNVLDIPQRILRGPNNAFNTVPTGDDVFWPASGSPQEIHPGPNGILDSVPQGDDVGQQDALCLPISNPANLPARDTNRLNSSGTAATTLQWFDNVDTGVWVRGDEPNGNSWQFIEWGRNFRPFIESFSAPALAKPGDLLLLLGSLGRQARMQPRLISPANQLIPLEVTSWTGAGATLRISREPVPSQNTVAGPTSGRYRLSIFDTATLQGAGNSYTVEIMNAPEDWRQGVFTAAELANASISGDRADPDLDGQPTLMEYLLGTDPRIANPSPLKPLVLPDRVGFSFIARNDRGNVRVTLQYSRTLEVWTDGQFVELAGTGNPGSTVIVSLLAPPTAWEQLFARLRFERY